MTRGTEDGPIATATPGVNAGVNQQTGKIFCWSLENCGYCGNTFKSSWATGRKPCPQCRSRKEVTA